MRFGENASKHRFEAVTVFGHPMLFTTSHLDHDTIPKGMYLYAVRHHSENLEMPVEISDWAVVNRYGSLLSGTPIALQPFSNPKIQNRFRAIDPEKDWSSNGYQVTLADYLREYPLQKPRKREQER